MKRNYLFTLLSCFSLLATLPAQIVPAYVSLNGLSGWWPFNGNGNDMSANSNSMLVNGATLTSDRNGIVNAAYYLDGVNDFLRTNAPCYNAAIDHSISFWLKIQDTLLYTQTIFSGTIWGIETLSYNHYISSNQQKLSLFLGNSSSWSIIYDDMFSVKGKGLDKWMHIVYVKTGLTCTFYINGVNTHIYSSSAALPAVATTMQFGAATLQNNEAEFYKGKIDDIGIWSRALTQNEVTDLYNAIELNVSLSESGGTTAFSVYPNPAANSLLVKAAPGLAGSGYVFYDITGKVVLGGKLSAETCSIDLESLSTGMYVFKLGEGKGQTLKIVKE